MVDYKARETLCGLGSWRPAFLQKLASKKVYMLLYGIIGIIRGMQSSYLSSMLTTLERKFGIKSKETAYLMSGDEIAQIIFLFFLPLTVSAKKRPLWCGIAMAITAIGLYMMALPHLITGGAPILSVLKKEVNKSEEGLCGSDVHFNSLENSCDEDGSRIIDWVGLVFIFLGVVLTGIGKSLFWCFGLVYLDDNTGKKNSPFMLGITFCFGLIGPMMGYFLGAACLQINEYPGIDPGFKEGDPRWIGAWWIGFTVIGTLLFLCSVPLCFFPQRLPKTHETDAIKEANVREALTGEDVTERTNFMEALKRLSANKLYMCNFFSNIFYIFAFMGFGTFMPKYMEYVFRMKSSRTATYGGGMGSLPSAVGFLVSGWVIGKYKFTARVICAWSCFISFVAFFSLIMFSQIGCPTSEMYGKITDAGNYDIDLNCNVNCTCPTLRLQPICSKDGVTNFYSPCHAGCREKVTIPDLKDPTKNTTLYKSCECVRQAKEDRNTSLSKRWIERETMKEVNIKYPALSMIDRMHKKLAEQPVTEAVAGWCEVEGCMQKFYMFMGIGLLLGVLGSTSRIGNTLVALRCVEVRDKSLSIAVQVVALSLLAAIPSPIMFGAIIDTICILWQKECGGTTNCLLYDTDLLRQRMMLVAAGIMLTGIILDIGVWYFSKSLEIFPDEEVLTPTADEDAAMTTRNIVANALGTSQTDKKIFGSHISLGKI